MPGPELKATATLDDNPFSAALRRMEQNTSASAAQMATALSSSTSTAIAGIELAGKVAAKAFDLLATPVKAIASGTRDVFDLTRNLENLSERTGITVGRLYELTRTFQAAGLEADDTGAAVNRMQKFLQEAESGEAKNNDLLRRLHTSFLQLHSLSPEQQFAAIGKAIASLPTPTAQGAAAMEVFSRSGGRMLAIFKDPNFKTGAALSERAKLLQENAASMDEASVKLSRAGDVFKSFYTGVAVGVATPLNAVLDRVEQVDLSKYGEMFAVHVFDGSTSLIEMLVQVKNSPLVPIAEQFGAKLMTGADAVVKMLVAVKDADLPGIAEKFATRMGTVSKVVSPLTSNLSAPTSGMMADMVMPGSGAILALLPTITKKVGEVYSGNMMLLDAVGKLPALGAKLTSGHASKAAEAFKAAGAQTPTGAAAGAGEQDHSDHIDVVGHSSIFNTPGMQWGQMAGDASTRSGPGQTWDGATAINPARNTAFANFLANPGGAQFSNVFDETASVGLQTGKLSTSGLSNAGGLSGPGSDTAEESRQSVAKIRAGMMYQNPLLQGGALNQAVAQEQRRQQDQKKVDQYRQTYDKQHPVEAEARKAQEKNVKPATSADIKASADRFEKAIHELLIK